MGSRFIQSSDRHPCPVCGRTKDADCRMEHDSPIVLCHSEQDRQHGDVQEEYRYLSRSDKGAGYGVWIHQDYFEEKIIKPERDITYRYPVGKRIILVRRTDDGKGNKRITQGYEEGSRTFKSLPEDLKAAAPLYRQEEFIAALERGELGFLAEGEGVADVLWQKGLAATCTIGGSSGYGKDNEYPALAKYRDQIVLAPDCDEVGVKYMAHFAEKYGINRWCLAKPGKRWEKPYGGFDLEDWIAQGATAENILSAIGDKRPGSGKPEEGTIQEKAEQLRAEILDWANETDHALKLVKQCEITQRRGIRANDLHTTAIALLQAQRGGAGKPIAYSGTDFLNVQDEDEQFLIGGLIPDYGSVLLVGQPGTNKTILSLQIALAVANGRDLFQFPTVKQGKVLVIASDQPARVTRQYMRAMAPAEDWANVIVIAPDAKNGIPAWIARDIGELELQIEQHQPALTIIDSLQRTVCSPMRINSKEAEEIVLWMTRIQDITGRSGSTLWIHHAGKSKELEGAEKAMGSIQIVAQTDVVLRLEKEAPGDPSNPYRTLHVDKSRGFEGSSSRLKFEAESSQLDYQGEAGLTPDLAERSLTQSERILNFLKRNYRLAEGKPVGFEPVEIEEATGIPNVRPRLNKLYTTGKIQRRESPNHYKGYVYFLYASPGAVEAEPLPEDETPAEAGDKLTEDAAPWLQAIASASAMNGNSLPELRKLVEQMEGLPHELKQYIWKRTPRNVKQTIRSQILKEPSRS